MADLARIGEKGKKREKVFARFRRTSKECLPSLLLVLFFSFSFSFSILLSSLSFVVSFFDTLALFHLFAFRHFRISFLLTDPRARAFSYAAPSVFSPFCLVPLVLSKNGETPTRP